MSEKELKNCPFCGGLPELNNGMGEYWVSCHHCGASGGMVSTENDAKINWNQRFDKGFTVKTDKSFPVNEVHLIEPDGTRHIIKNIGTETGF